MSVPYATESQVEAMKRIAEEKYGKIEEPVVDNSAPVEDNVSQVEETAPVIDEQDAESTPYIDEQQEAAPKFTPDPKESFKNLRMAKEKAERERDEMFKHILESQKSQQKPAPVQPEEDILAEFGIDADGLAEGKHLRSLVKEIRNLKNEVNQYKISTTQNVVEAKIKATMPDFDQVASNENCAMLRQMDPDLADAILATNDPYKQATLAYKMVKQYGIYKDKKFEADTTRAIANSAKPRPLTSIAPQQAETPMSKANAFANGPLTAEAKAHYLREMQEAIKGR